MDSLVRTRVSAFSLENAHTLAEIEAYRVRGALDEIMMPVDAVFEGIPKRQVKPEALRLLQNGNRLEERDFVEKSGPAEITDAGRKEPDGNTQKNWVLVYDDQGIFRAVYQHLPEAGAYKPVKMFL